MTDSEEDIPHLPSSTIRWIIAGLLAVVFLVIVFLTNDAHQSVTPELIEGGISIDEGDLKINWSRYGYYDVILSETYTITNPGTYHLSGDLIDGAVIINVDDESAVKLILDNVSISNSDGPAIACYNADDLVIELVGDNYLEDGAEYNKEYGEDVKSVVYSKSDLTFQGKGDLDVVANYQDGIVGKDDVKFSSGSYTIMAKDDAIRGNDSVYIIDGVFDISARGDGIKATNTTTAGKGFVLIENGSFEIAVGDDGIHAERSLIINDGAINISKSYEGLEAQNIIINDGEISIYASDDGINAGGGSDDATSNEPRGGGAFSSDTSCILSFEGGNVYINSSGDGVDSNGYIHFNGGTVIVDGPTNNGNGALDAGISINQTGGIVIAVGSSGMAESLGNASSIYNISVFFESTNKAGTELKIKHSDNKTIIRHTSAKAFNHIAVGTKEFEFGETYTLYLDGVEYETFTIDGITTTVGSGTTMPQEMMPPDRPNSFR